MNALLREIRTLPHIEGRLAIRVLADETSDGFCLFRTDAELWPNLGDGGLREAAYRGG